MASIRMLPDTVVLSNYVGEVNDVATFQETTITHVFCSVDEGSAIGNTGRKADDSVSLFIFDRRSVATDSAGNMREYLPYNQWKALSDKSGYWTLNDGGRDTFKKVGSDKEYTITDFGKYKIGSPRMWHTEVNGR